MIAMSDVPTEYEWLRDWNAIAGVKRHKHYWTNISKMKLFFPSLVRGPHIDYVLVS